MGVVYAPHRCKGRPDEIQQPVGSIWLCEECGRYSRKFGAHGHDWQFVRWYHFRTLRQIGRLT